MYSIYCTRLVFCFPVTIVGGELVIYENENTTIEANKEKGNVILFNSELLHEAKEIIKGNRYVLVSWLSKNDLNLKSTLL